MSLRFEVQVADIGVASYETVRTARGLTLVQARRMCTRAARRGVVRYGGRLTWFPWGATGGRLSHRRSATIRVDPR